MHAGGDLCQDSILHVVNRDSFSLVLSRLSFEKFGQDNVFIFVSSQFLHRAFHSTNTIVDQAERIKRRNKMVKTRGVKPSKTLAELDLDLLNRMEDLELWEAEKSEPKNGNARCNSKLDASLDQIPPEILTNVVEFMNDVRDIYHLSITSKSFRESVSDTAIMRACIFSAGTTTKNKTQKHTPLILSNLMEKMTTIRPPSTLRLLRLVNAKRCERGDVCFGYNSKLKTAMPLRDNTMTKRPFGMALCTTCVSNLSSKKTILWSSPRDPLMRARIAHEQDTYLLHAAEEQATKEAIGPYVLALGVSQIKYSYNVREERTQAVEALLATVHEVCFSRLREVLIPFDISRSTHLSLSSSIFITLLGNIKKRENTHKSTCRHVFHDQD